MPTFAGNQLKRFFSRAELDNNRSEAHNTIQVRDALEGEEEPQSRNIDVDGRAIEDLMPVKSEEMEE